MIQQVVSMEVTPDVLEVKGVTEALHKHLVSRMLFQHNVIHNAKFVQRVTTYDEVRKIWTLSYVWWESEDTTLFEKEVLDTQ